MVTSNSSSVWLKVRFLSPAPIFVFLVMICLCGSAGAVSLVEDTVYSFGDFPAYFASSSSSTFTDSPYLSTQDSTSLTTTSSMCGVLISGSGSGSGTFTTSSPNLSYFDKFSPAFSFLKVSFSYPRTAADVGFESIYDSIDIWFNNSSSATPFYRSVVGYISNNQYIISTGGTRNYIQYCVPYAYTVDVAGGFVKYDVYFAFSYDYYPIGISVGFRKPSSVTSSSWSPNTSEITFELSIDKILPPDSSGGSGGSVDLSSITSQINSLSAQMTSSFQQVNANIDSAEASISNSIDNQTTALEGAISDAAGDININFNNWDSSLSGAFSSADGQVVVDANTAVSGVHQIEADAVEDAGNHLTDAGIDSYDLPADYKASLLNMSYLLGLLFDSCSWITDLVIFSCTFGIAFVLIGRKSRGA